MPLGLSQECGLHGILVSRAPYLLPLSSPGCLGASPTTGQQSAYIYMISLVESGLIRDLASRSLFCFWKLPRILCEATEGLSFFLLWVMEGPFHLEFQGPGGRATLLERAGGGGKRGSTLSIAPSLQDALTPLGSAVSWVLIFEGLGTIGNPKAQSFSLPQGFS